mmetsp:Transcript_666/g.1351  ORF Transcript_666/g.1351 Transcript_666/m.1351 type:complete len:147 (-) Transcript_666:175-615(-)
MLKNMKNGFFGVSNPFYEISRLQSTSLDNSRWIVVYRSDVIFGRLSPKWKMDIIPLSKICNCNIVCPLKISVYDQKSDGRHGIIGEFTTSLHELVDGANNNFSLMWECSNNGTLKLHRATILHKNILYEQQCCDDYNEFSETKCTM